MCPRSKLSGPVSTAIAALAIVLAGCGGSDADSDSDEPADSSLAGALADVSMSGDGPADLTWVDVPAMLDAGDLPASTEDAVGERRWLTPIGLAEGDAMASGSGGDLGFDPLTGERTISVGSPPDDATRYDGVDTDAARGSFEDMGFEETSTENGDFLALGDEGEVIVSAVDEFGQGPIGINRVAIDGDTLAFGAYEEPVAASLGGSPPLSDQPGFAAAADCLGSEAFAARIVDSQGMASEGVTLVAVGLSTPDGEVVPEEVCAVGAPNGSVDSTADCMASSFAGIDPVTRQPFSDLLGDAELETGESDGSPWVRASFAPPADRPVGVVFEMLEKGSLSSALGGTDPAALLGGRVTPAQVKALQDQLGDCGPG
jgi:hypothetical protein